VVALGKKQCYNIIWRAVVYSRFFALAVEGGGRGFCT
jgi:hypothetical protein